MSRWKWTRNRITNRIELIDAQARDFSAPIESFMNFVVVAAGVLTGIFQFSETFGTDVLMDILKNGTLEERLTIVKNSLILFAPLVFAYLFTAVKLKAYAKKKDRMRPSRVRILIAAQVVLLIVSLPLSLLDMLASRQLIRPVLADFIGILGFEVWQGGFWENLFGYFLAYLCTEISILFIPFLIWFIIWGILCH